jgi:predicted nucleic acid-binding protein
VVPDLSVRPVTVETHRIGREIASEQCLSMYDTMTAAAALHAGCATLWSEDMQDAMVLEGLLRVAITFRYRADQA